MALVRESSLHQKLVGSSEAADASFPLWRSCFEKRLPRIMGSVFFVSVVVLWAPGLIQPKTDTKQGFGHQPNAYAGIWDQATSESGPPTSATINVMQWAAHWKCFNAKFFGATCAPMVKELLETWLSDYKLDFVNLGMFQDDSWNPPENYGFLDYKCSMDNIKVLYDGTKWRLSALQKLPEDLVATAYHPPKDTDVFGCSNENADGSADRVYGVMAFEQRKKDYKVIVVAGHLPHPPGGSSSAANSVAMLTAPLLREQMAPKIKHIKEQPGWEDARVLFLGDTNNNIDAIRDSAFDNPANIKEAFAVMDAKTVEAVKKMKGQIRDVDGAPIEKTVGEALQQPNRGWIEQPIMTSEDIWEALQTGYPVSASNPFGTCCADKPAMVGDSVAFPYTFDRIMASFGPLHTIMPLQVLLKKPDAADELVKKLFVGAFHMPIIATATLKQSAAPSHSDGNASIRTV